ncbi:Interleukin-8, partial [Lamprotornis superbus]
ILEVNGNLSCRCAKTTSEYISPKKYESIEIRPVGSSCRRTEIIIKLRTSGKVCVNPEAPWVKKLLKRIASTNPGSQRQPELPLPEEHPSLHPAGQVQQHRGVARGEQLPAARGGLKSRKRVCVDPDTLWVKKLLQDLPHL